MINLYSTDRQEWIKRTAPGMAIRAGSMTDSELSRVWGVMGRDYQVATWRCLTEDQRERIKGLR